MRCMERPRSYHRTALICSVSGFPRGVVRVNGKPHGVQSCVGFPATEPLLTSRSLWPWGHPGIAALPRRHRPHGPEEAYNRA
jgi:hypothetical protein